jgi:acyl carrier protein
MHIVSLYSSPPGNPTATLQNRFSRAEIEAAVQTILTKVLGVNEASTAQSARLKNDLGADSLDLTDIIVEVEKYFHITISDHRIEKVKTVGDLVNCVEILTTGRI